MSARALSANPTFGADAHLSVRPIQAALHVGRKFAAGAGAPGHRQRQIVRADTTVARRSPARPLWTTRLSEFEVRDIELPVVLGTVSMSKFDLRPADGSVKTQVLDATTSFTATTALSRPDRQQLARIQKPGQPQPSERTQTSIGIPI